MKFMHYLIEYISTVHLGEVEPTRIAIVHKQGPQTTSHLFNLKTAKLQKFLDFKPP